MFDGGVSGRCVGVRGSMSVLVCCWVGGGGGDWVDCGGDVWGDGVGG